MKPTAPQKKLKTESRTADKFVVRMPDGMRERLEAHAATQHSSMNSSAVQGIESYLDGHDKLNDLLAATALLRKHLEEQANALELERVQVAELKAKLEQQLP